MVNFHIQLSQPISLILTHAQCNATTILLYICLARLKHDGTRAEIRFGLSAKRMSPFKSAGGQGQFSRLLAAEVCGSAVVMVAILDTPCSEVECKTTGYPLHSHVSPSLPRPCVTVCHQVPNTLYQQPYVINFRSLLS